MDSEQHDAQRQDGEHVEAETPTDVPPAPASQAAEMAGPVQQRQRIQSIDVLRGFALCGILVMNIRMFARVFASYSNPTVYDETTGADWWVFAAGHVLADLKMMAIFSMLFGAGIVLMTSRQGEKGLGSAGVHYRRMGWLLFIGLCHAYLIWSGDILVMYAWCGMLVYLVRRWYAWIQLLLGACLLLIGTVIMLGAGFTIDQWPEESVNGMMASWAPTAEQIQPEVDAYRGSWLDQMSQRVPMSLGFQIMGLFFFGLWRAGGLMLVGMALYKWGIFSARRSLGFYLGLAVVCAGIGVPLILYGVSRNIEDGWVMETAFFLNSQFNYIGSIFVALAWVGLVMLVVKLELLKFLTRALAAVGQMALTNYLMQSIICTTIFYGHGLGHFGEFTYLEQFYVVLGVWIVELIWSPLWLWRFRFGPFEWLWRSLTYWRWQPMLRPTGDRASV